MMKKEKPFWMWSFDKVKISDLKNGDVFCFYDNNAPEFKFRRIENKKIIYSAIQKKHPFSYLYMPGAFDVDEKREFSCSTEFYKEVYQVNESSKY